MPARRDSEANHETGQQTGDRRGNRVPRYGAARTVRQVLAADQDAMQVALRATVGHVAPVVILVNLPQLGEPVQDADLRVPLNRDLKKSGKLTNLVLSTCCVMRGTANSPRTLANVHRSCFR